MFLNKSKVVLDLNKLNEEAKALNTKIQIVLLFGTQNLRFSLSSELTTEEEQQLDDFLDSFEDSDPALKVPKILDLANVKGKDFKAINYKSVDLKTSLIPVRTVNKGEVNQVLWFERLGENQVPENPILKVDIVYTRDASGFALFRVTTRTWFNRDGSENPDKKITQKYYFINNEDMIDEGTRRRRLLVKKLQIPAMERIAEVLMPEGISQTTVLLRGRKFLDDYEEEFNKFVDNSSSITETHVLDENGNQVPNPDFNMKTIIVKLRDETDPLHVEWMNKKPNSLGGSMTIRDWLMEEFNI